MLPLRWFENLNFFEWLAVGGWSIVLLVVLIRGGIFPDRHTVLPVYDRAAAHWLAGEPLYAGPIDFRYSPPVAVGFVPLSLLPARVGAVLWRAGSAGALLAALLLWIRWLLPQEVGRDRRAILLLLVLPLAGASIDNGQVNSLICALLLATCCAAYRSWWTWACLLIVIASAFKGYPLVFAGLLVLLFPRGMTLRLVLTIVICFIGSLFLREPSYVLARYSEWLQALAADNRQTWLLVRLP